MALCDELEAELTTAATTRRQLLEATLAEALPSVPALQHVRVKAQSVGESHHREHRAHRGRPRKDTDQLFSVPSVVNPTPPSTAPRNIPAAILAHMQPGRAYSRSALSEALGLSTPEWNWAIRALKESGKVLQVGERRGARYSVNSES